MAGTTIEQNWADATLNGLFAKGLRQGGARRAIVQALGEQDCCLTAQEIFDRLRGSDRSPGHGAGRRNYP